MECDVSAEAEDVKFVVVGGNLECDRSVKVARPAKSGGGGGGCCGEPGAGDEVVDNAGGRCGGAHACSELACRRDDAGVKALREIRVAERARIDLEVACDDERK